MRAFHAAVALIAGMAALGAAAPATILIDDFSREDASALGTKWQAFTDRVMGGLSNGQASFETLEGKRCLRLRGDVSLENQGGFVQAALPLVKQGGVFDAGGHTGIRIWVRGNGEKYYIHLRTTETALPWQYYQAAFDTDKTWRQVDIPFADFRAENLEPGLDTRKLKRLAVVAAKKAFSADVAVARIEFYE